MDFQKVGWEGGMDWIGLGENKIRRQALLNMVMNLWVP
jgi:hypothetical protein